MNTVWVVFFNLSLTELVAVQRISTRTSSSVPAPFMAFLSSFTA